ncbi:MAG: LPXTG cell wall anchor domain-containing protein, partial [Firmicutes bacterium]|nr:LPXTG cell wall anchor domain-containing protein [Bacillota bacterium]
GGQDVPLGGAEFDLYTTEGGETGEKIYEGLTSRDEDGLLTYGTDGEITVFELGDGVYHLVETKAPEGYAPKGSPVKIYISGDGAEVRYDEGTSLSSSGEGIDYESGVHTLSITNTAGIELPHTGGPGTAIFYIVGAVLTLGCAVMLISRRRIQKTK